MSRNRTGGDVHIGNREITLGDLRLEIGGLQVNRKAKVWECIMVCFRCLDPFACASHVACFHSLTISNPKASLDCSESDINHCRQGETGEITVNLEVQFKAIADLPGIEVPPGTLLKDAQTIEYTPKSDNDAQYYEKNWPLQDVGGKLRVRLLKVDCLPKNCQHGQMIFTRVMLGKQSSYGNKLCEIKDVSPRTPQASGAGATFYTKEVKPLQ
jgi:hypothetical protein